MISYTYDYNAGYDYNYIENRVVDVPNISTKKVFSKKKYLEMKADILNVKKEKDKYNNQMSLYNDIIKERKSVVDLVYEAINDAVDKENEKKRIIEQYNRYLALADNDVTTAKKFLADALHMTIDEVNDLVLE